MDSISLPKQTRARHIHLPFRHLPPTAVQAKWGDILAGLRSTLKPQRSLDAFSQSIKRYTGSSHCYLVSSGRAALTIALLALKTQSHGKKVIVPAFSCPTVVQSVLSAGLTPVFCDVLPETLGFNLEELTSRIDQDLLAVLPTHLYGVPQEMDDLLTLSREEGFALIEDAAQAFGARIDGKCVGALGDIGIYSLGRGKCLPTGYGGVIIAQAQWGAAIAKVLAELIPQTPRRDGGSLAGYLGYALATHPFFWWFIARSPLNPANYEMSPGALPSIHYHNLPASQAGVGLSILARLQGINATRRRAAKRIMGPLSAFHFLTFPAISPEAEPVYLRLPLIVKRKRDGERLFQRLGRAGIGVSKSYYRTLPSTYENLLPVQEEVFPGAAKLAACLYTLPTHPYMQENDFELIVEICEEVERTTE
jgi:dTDP-4-amino-4,6-dideoxygalactose transaminase